MRRYAVIWDDGVATHSGRLELHAGWLELHDRDGSLSLAFDDVDDAMIARARRERLRGLPVLALHRRDGGVVRIASLEGAGMLHELSVQVERAGLTVAA